MSESAEHQADHPLSFERIVFFSDAVFAISITLLVLDIKLPDLPRELAAAELPGRLLDLAPKFLSYAISFLVIGLYWVGHHRMFRYITRYDGRLIWLNILLLMCVAFLPFPSALIGTYGNTQVAVIFYAASQVVTGLAAALLYWYATSGHRLVDEDLDPRVARYAVLRTLVAPAVFLLSIGVSFLSTAVAEYSWWLLAVLLIVSRVRRPAAATERAGARSRARRGRVDDEEPGAGRDDGPGEARG